MAGYGTVGATASSSRALSYFSRSPAGMGRDLISLMDVAAAGSRYTCSLPLTRALQYHTGKYSKRVETRLALRSRSFTVSLPAIQRRRLPAAASGDTVQRSDQWKTTLLLSR